VRTRAKVLSVLSSGAVLLIGWQLGSQVGSPSPSTAQTTGGASSSTKGASGTGSTSGTSGTSGTGGTTGSGSTGSSGSGSASSGSSSPSSGSSTGADGTFTGESVQTRYGTVQVSVTVSGGKVSDVTALHLTDAERRSVMISNEAAPILRQEVLDAQSANVSIVSGATYTSEAYLQSAQSALKAGGR
jgi:uncharacterized protein with FMN-binding domain